MPLETIDKDPFWSKRMRMSGEDKRRQKEAALAAGRDTWNAATRLGHDVKARTESELAALGRKALEAKVRAQRTADAVTRSTIGTSTNPTAVRVVGEWATGLGSQKRELGPDAVMTKEFAQAGNTKAHLRNAVDHWKARPGGLDANGGAYTSYRAVFGPKEVVERAPTPRLRRSAARNLMVAASVIVWNGKQRTTWACTRCSRDGSSTRPVCRRWAMFVVRAR